MSALINISNFLPAYKIEDLLNKSLDWVGMVNEEIIKQKQDIIEDEKALHGFISAEPIENGNNIPPKNINKKTEEKLLKNMGLGVIKKRWAGQARVIK